MRLKGIIVLLTVLVFFTPALAGCSDADSDDISYFDVKIVNNDGTEAEGILGHSYTVDTVTDITGTTFILRANISLQAKPANLLIESPEGTFNCYVTVTGLSSYLEEAGIRVQLTDGEKTYNSDNSKATQFVSTYFTDENDSRAVLKPNVMYPLSIMTLDDVEHEAPPEKIEKVVVEFTAHLKEGMHQIAFFSEGEMVDAYKLADGQAIRPLPPAPERSGYDFGGWFTKDGRAITEGYVVTEDDGDIIGYAKWTATPVSSDSFNWLILVIIGAVVVSMIIAFLLVKRRGLI